MDWTSKFFITSIGAMLVLGVAHRFGQRIAGLVAALPLGTAPALLWLAHDHGVNFAVGAAVGSVAACAMLACFALGFSCAARRGSLAALLVGGAAAALMALPIIAVSGSLVLSLALAAISSAAVQAALPTAHRRVASRSVSHLRMLAAAMTVGASTAVLAAAGPWLDNVATGLLSSLPLIGATAAVLEHARGGHAASTQFLRGYVTGLFGKAAFGAVFAILSPQTGSAAALALACASAAVLSVLLSAHRTVERPRELVEA